MRVGAALIAAIAVVVPACALSPEEDPGGPELVETDDPESGETALVRLAGPTGQWVWFDIPGTTCGNGSQTGLGVNIGTGSDLLIYMEGGGACWDELTCSIGVDGLGLASYIHSGYGREQFEAATPASGIFDRSLPENPFRDSTLIYIPYCTGDLHAGSTTQWHHLARRTMHFAGRQNLDAYLAQIVQSFPDPSRVTLSGSSAGGWGSTFNYWRVADAFGDARVDLVADSSPMFERYSLLLLGQGAWGLSSALPPGCASCANDFRAIHQHYASAYPDSRFAYLSYDADLVVNLGALMDPLTFHGTLKRLQFDTIRPIANARFFAPGGTAHTMLYDLAWVASGSVTLGDFLTEMASDSPNWSNKAPWGTSCPDGTGTVLGAIESKYLELGACGSLLGAPTTHEMVLPDLFGRANHFEEGSIYWHPRTGAHEVHGATRQVWQQWGWELSALGYPTTDEIETTTGNGRKTLFEGGGIYSSTATGTHAVFGDIFARWSSLGAEESALGLPTSDELPVGPLGLDRRSNFEHGSITWSRLTRATSVTMN
jgi:hypothetical protein